METHEDGNIRLTKIGPLGAYGNNAYIIADSKANQALIVDMPAGSQRVLQAAHGLEVKAILLTHTHPDHWAEYDLVKAATGAPVICHPAETIMPAAKIDRALADGDEIEVGSVTVRTIHTPGHTPGSACFLAGRFLISGDTLFPGGPGHTTSPENLRQALASIAERLLTLPEDTLVLPGHGDDATIGRSKREYEAFVSRPHPPDLCGDVTWEG